MKTFKVLNVKITCSNCYQTENVKPTTPRVLITGASGHNGKKVAELLLATKLVRLRKHQVVIFSGPCSCWP